MDIEKDIISLINIINDNYSKYKSPIVLYARNNESGPDDSLFVIVSLNKTMCASIMVDAFGLYNKEILGFLDSGSLMFPLAILQYTRIYSINYEKIKKDIE